MVGQQLSQLDLQETAGGARAERGETSREEEIEKERETGAAAVAKVFLSGLLHLGSLHGCNTPPPGFALESWIPSPLLPLRLEAPTYMQHYLSSPCLDRHGLSMPGTDKSIPFLTSFWKSQEMGSLVLEGLRRGLKLVTSRPPSQRDPT